MAISLDEMLRDYQRNAVDAILALPPGSRRLYVAPCGTGKSYVEVAVQRARPDSLIVTPRTEIADGMVEKGADPARIYTPITLRNRMMDQRVGSPSLLLCDEAHHDTCDTAETIRLCCNADTTIIGFTATPYRGSPLGTRALRELYGEPHYILTLTAAIQRGLCVVPQCATIPILDDDIVTIQNGEFSVQGVGKHTPWQDAAEMIRTYWQAERRPTVVSLPSVQSCQVMQDLCQVPTCIITGETPALGRANGFRRCMDGDAVLLQVQVVSEGVDLHLRRLIDLAPTQSPTRWLQQVGRVMRPVGESEYICTNRNLLRHGYLLEGVLPVEALQSAQLAFPTVSKRSGSRAFGLEGLGKLPCWSTSCEWSHRVHLLCESFGGLLQTRVRGHRSTAEPRRSVDHTLARAEEWTLRDVGAVRATTRTSRLSICPAWSTHAAAAELVAAGREEVRPRPPSGSGSQDVWCSTRASTFEAEDTMNPVFASQKGTVECLT